jgi:hypothetical protein
LDKKSIKHINNTAELAQGHRHSKTFPSSEMLHDMRNTKKHKKIPSSEQHHDVRKIINFQHQSCIMMWRTNKRKQIQISINRMNQNIRAGPGTENSQHQNFPKYKKQTKGKNNNPQITEQNKSMMLKNIGENKLWAPAFGSTWNKPDFPEKIAVLEYLPDLRNLNEWYLPDTNNKHIRTMDKQIPSTAMLFWTRNQLNTTKQQSLQWMNSRAKHKTPNIAMLLGQEIN